MTSRQSNAFPPTEPLALLEVAAELAGRERPAFLRSSGDRAYYAAFLHSRDQLTRRNYAQFAHRRSIHGQVIQALTRIDRRMGRLLDELRAARNRLTYETGLVTLRANRTLQWMLDAARSLINFVNSLPFRS